MSLTIWEAALVIAIKECNHSAAILIYPPDGPVWQADCVACIHRLTGISADLSGSLQCAFSMDTVDTCMEQAGMHSHALAQTTLACCKRKTAS